MRGLGACFLIPTANTLKLAVFVQQFLLRLELSGAGDDEALDAEVTPENCSVFGGRHIRIGGRLTEADMSVIATITE